jgi:Lar family restriction alleviation protein
VERLIAPRKGQLFSPQRTLTRISTHGSTCETPAPGRLKRTSTRHPKRLDINNEERCRAQERPSALTKRRGKTLFPLYASAECVFTEMKALHFKLCPHCGCTSPEIVHQNESEEAWHCVACPDCGASSGLRSTEEEAAEAWNRRHERVSAAGGRATHGISTKKKHRACRRNLKKARAEKYRLQLNREVERKLAELWALRARHGERPSL